MLNRKVIRDLWRSRLLFSAIVLLLAVGIGMFVTMYSAFQSLEASESFTYRELKFADVFYRLAPAPAETVDLARQVEGVAAVEGRMVQDVPIRHPDNPRSAALARVISLPDTGRPTVNDVAIQSGEYLPKGISNSILLDDQFAGHYGLKPGDSIALIIEGEETPLHVQGTFTSPEYIWKAKSDQEPFVGKGDFAVVLARSSVVADLLGTGGHINEIVVRFEPGADPDSTTAALSEALSRYGVQRITKRADQISYALLKLDMEGFGEIAVVVPILFLIITAMVIYVLLARIVHSQRSLVGLMRAVGFSRGQVLRHFLVFSLAIAVVGDALGIVLGLVLGSYITNLYVDTVGIPFTVMESQAEIVGIAVVIGLVVCTIAGLLPARAAANLQPSEAMRPTTPRASSSALLDRLLPMGHLPYTLRLALRNMVRGSRRTFSSLLGVTAAVALVVASVGMMDSMSHAFSVQFDEIQRYDLKVSFTGPTPAGEVAAYGSWAEVGKAEPIVEVPVTLKHGDESSNTVLVALPQDSSLLRLRHADGAAPLTGGGLFLSKGLANVLKVEVGDRIDVTSELGTTALPVAGLVTQPLSGAAYMGLPQTKALFGGTYVTGALLKLSNPRDDEAVKERLHATPGVLAVEQPEETRQSFQELMSLFYQFVGIFVVFGVALGSIAVFNTITINIVERSRELATMRTLGFSNRSLDLLLTVENLLGGAVGILLGLVVGYLLEVELLTLFQSELFTLDVFIKPTTYLIIGVSSLVVLLLSQAPGLRSLHRIDLAAATKERVS